MPSDPYEPIYRLLRNDSPINVMTAIDILNRIRHEHGPTDPIPPEMHKAINEIADRWAILGDRAERHMRSGRGLNGYPFGDKPKPEDNLAANSAVTEAIRAILEGRRLKKGPISELEAEAFLKSLDNEDSLREFCQTGKVHSSGAGKVAPLVFWRRGAGDASAIAEAYRAGKVQRPWDPDVPDGEVGFISDWTILYIGHRKGLSRWSSVLPQVRRRVGPFLRHRSVRKAQREARTCVDRFQARGLVKGVDQTLWAGWCTPEGLELVHRKIRPLWEELAGLSRSANSPRTW